MPPLVLAYHAVSERWEHALSVAPAVLARHVGGLVRRGHRPASLDDVLAGRAGRSLHVTFDDAFASTGAGLDALARLGVPATIFACTGYTDGGSVFAVPELALAAAAQPTELATMDWAALRAAVAAGVEIGSHTVSHARLTRLGDGELEMELKDSRRRLEDELGVRCRVLAYPYGEHDARVRRAAALAGYSAAFALSGSEGRRDPFALPRVGVYRGESALRLALKTRPFTLRVGAATLRALGVRSRRR